MHATVYLRYKDLLFFLEVYGKGDVYMAEAFKVSRKKAMPPDPKLSIFCYSTER
jgi:hypothetical protein